MNPKHAHTLLPYKVRLMIMNENWRVAAPFVTKPEMLQVITVTVTVRCEPRPSKVYLYGR